MSTRQRYGAFEYEVLDMGSEKPHRPYRGHTGIYRSLHQSLENIPSGKWFKVKVVGDGDLTQEQFTKDLEKKKGRIRAAINGYSIKFVKQNGLKLNTSFSNRDDDLKEGAGYVFVIKLPEAASVAEYFAE